MLLGVVFRYLYAVPLLIFNVSVSSCVLVYSLRFCGSRQTCYHDILTAIWDEIIEKFRWLSGEVRNDLVLLILFVLFAVSVSWILLTGYLFPSYTWDALWYHLPIVGYIMQSGAIEEVPNNSFIDQFINIFPKNIELFFLWNIIFLQSDVITDLSQLLFTITGIFTVYSVSVKLGVKERYSLCSALLFFFTPIIVLQSSTNYVDIAVSVLFLMALNFLLSSDGDKGKEQSPGPSVISYEQRKTQGILAGLSAGILLGSKGSGPLFAIVLSAAFIVRELIRRFKHSNHRNAGTSGTVTATAVSYITVFLIPVFLIGGYWYIKNWVVYGNPVYPMDVSLGNLTLFKGLYKGIIEPAPAIINELKPAIRPLYVWVENIDYYLYDSRLGGLGPIWFILFLPAILFTCVLSVTRKDYRFLAFFVIITVTFLIHPRNWTPRYVIFIVGLGAVSFASVTSYFSDKIPSLRIIALLLAGYTAVTANSPCVTPEQVRKFLALPANQRTISRHAPFNIDIHAHQEYGYWEWIHRNMGTGDSLAYTFEPLFLSPLWNSSFSSSIAYVKADTYDQWLSILKASKVSHILTRKNSHEDTWTTADMERFSEAYSDDYYKISLVNRNED